MEIKYTMLGGLIYATMAMYAMAFVMSVLAKAIKPLDQESDPQGDEELDLIPDTSPGPPLPWNRSRSIRQECLPTCCSQPGSSWRW